MRPGIRRAVRESPHPRGSSFGDVTWARIAPGGLARIERRRIVSRWARTARGEADCVALSSHYASRARPAPAGPHRPGPVADRPGLQLKVVANLVPVPAPSHPASGRVRKIKVQCVGAVSTSAAAASKRRAQCVGVGRLMVWISATGRSMVVVVVRASRVPPVPLVEVQVMS